MTILEQILAGLQTKFTGVDTAILTRIASKKAEGVTLSAVGAKPPKSGLEEVHSTSNVKAQTTEFSNHKAIARGLSTPSTSQVHIPHGKKVP